MMWAPMSTPLTSAQRLALTHVTERALRARPAMVAQIEELCKSQAVPFANFEHLSHLLVHQGRVELHFHPDRIVSSGSTVVEALLREGRYRSQFETGISNGGLTAFAGGDRDNWEGRLFAAAYQHESVTPGDRPKYGALNLLNLADGSAPRFGSCFFTLKHPVSHRTTFSYGDSVLEPDYLGTFATFTPVWLALVKDVVTNSAALGLKALSLADLFDRIAAALAGEGTGRFLNPPTRHLDAYIEAQVHGPIHLANDIHQLVVDVAFKETATGDHLIQLSQRYGFPLRYHAGFQLPVANVPDEFRGPRMPDLAHRITTGKILNVTHIGLANQALHHKPETWSDWDSYANTLQDLKKLWHVLVAFGQPNLAALTTS